MKITSVKYTATVGLPNYESEGLAINYDFNSKDDTPEKAYEDFNKRTKDFAIMIGAKAESKFLK